MFSTISLAPTGHVAGALEKSLALPPAIPQESLHSQPLEPVYPSFPVPCCTQFIQNQHFALFSDTLSLDSLPCSLCHDAQSRT